MRLGEMKRRQQSWNNPSLVLVLIAGVIVHFCCQDVVAVSAINRNDHRGFQKILFLQRKHHQIRGGAEDEKKEDDEFLKVKQVADLNPILSDNDDNDDLMETKDENDEMTLESVTETASETASEEVEEKEEFVFGGFKEGDGSEMDPDGLPDRYLRMAKGDRVKAKKAFENTLEWRKENDVDRILQRSFPKFDLCRRVFPVFISGRDDQGHISIVQRPGKIDFAFGNAQNVTEDDLLMHYVFLCEYLWNILDPGPPDAVMTTIIDMKNVGFILFSDKKKRKFIFKFVAMMSEHYPQRSFKTLIINVPHWSNIAWQATKPMLRESTRKKIQLLTSGKKQDAVLRSILGQNNVPPTLLCSNNNNNKDKRQDKKNNHNDNVEEDIALVHSNFDRDLRLFVSIYFSLPYTVISLVFCGKIYCTSFFLPKKKRIIFAFT